MATGLRAVVDAGVLGAAAVVVDVADGPVIADLVAAVAEVAKKFFVADERRL